MTDNPPPRKTVLVPRYEWCDETTPHLYHRDLEEALRIGPTMVEMGVEAAEKLQGFRLHFEWPKIPPPEALSEAAQPPREIDRAIDRFDEGGDRERGRHMLEYLVIRGTRGWKRDPTLKEVEHAIRAIEPSEYDTWVLEEWIANAFDWRLLALGWRHGMYTPAELGRGLKRCGLERCEAGHHLRLSCFHRPGYVPEAETKAPA